MVIVVAWPSLATKLPAIITPSERNRGENRKSRDKKAWAKVREVTDETDLT